MSAAHTHAAHAPPGDDRRYLRIALALIVSFMVVEAVVAFASGSLALLADAAHMLTDAAAIAAALWALRLAARAPSASWTFGLKRAEILSAAGNGLVLGLAGLAILVEAILRLVHPAPVDGLALVVVAIAGVGVNLAATRALSRADRHSLNVEGAWRHVVTDLYAFVATAAAGALILALGWRRADPVASLLVVGLMARAAWPLLWASGRILLQGTPEGVDLDEVRRHITELPEVVSVHALHAWALTSQLPVLSAHVVIADSCLADGTAPQVLDRLQDCLSGHFDVEHSTFQLEPGDHAAHEFETHR